jgi:cellulose synthase/poly-beta-1,6-N-acetylglucosamine synthase-like glycosyltransferase
MTIVISFLSSLYVLFLGYLYIGAFRLYRKEASSGIGPSVTVVVPLRNEEKAVQGILSALRQQDYNGKWDVICVNDRSTDNTGPLLDSFCQANNNFTLININQDEAQVASSKKRALGRAFNVAGGEILMTTDADCLPGPGWIKSMALAFTPSVSIVQGPKKVNRSQGLLNRYQCFETFGFVSLEAATFAWGKPLLASAPSLAYRRSLFQSVGGFEGLEHLVSGDDDMLVHKMVTRGKAGVFYNLDPEACVITSPALTWRELFQQRARWSSNGLNYTSKAYIGLLIGLYLFYCWIIVSPILIPLLNLSWWYFFTPFLLKLSTEFAFFSKTALKLQQVEVIKDFWWVELVNFPILIISVVLGQLGWYKWKI